jgi:sensor histidine kinase YesM
MGKSTSSVVSQPHAHGSYPKLTQIMNFMNVSRDTSIIYIDLFSVGLGHQISGIYPTIIISIVNFKQTFWGERHCQHHAARRTEQK